MKTLKAFAALSLGAAQSAVSSAALAGFSRPLHDVPEQLGTGVFAIDQQWTLIGLLGLVVVVALLAGFYSRDK